jgi:hypothetical protein
MFDTAKLEAVEGKPLPPTLHGPYPASFCFDRLDTAGSRSLSDLLPEVEV